MKTCPNCSFENQDETKFCIKCGAPFNNAAEVNTQKPAKKSSPVVKVLLVAVALLLVAFIVMNIIIASNPAMRLLNGLERLGKMDAYTVTSTVTAKYKGDNDDLEQLINNASFKTSYAVNLEKALIEFSADILYDNKSIAAGAAGLGDKVFYIDAGNLYDKDFIYELDDEELGYISEIKVLLKYIRQADIKFDKKKYAKAIADVLDDHIKGSLDKVTLTLDNELLYETLAEVFETMADDEVLMKSFRENAKDVINKILKDKHEFEFLFYEDDLEELLEYIDDKDEFEDAFLRVVEGAADAFNDMLDELSYYTSSEDMTEIDITFSFGMLSNSIKGMQVSMALEDLDDEDESVKINIDSKIKGGASFAKINTKNAIDIEDLQDDYDQLEEISIEVCEKLADNITKNKKLAKAIEDITGVEADELSDLLIDELF